MNGYEQAKEKRKALGHCMDRMTQWAISLHWPMTSLNVSVISELAQEQYKYFFPYEDKKQRKME